MANTHARTPITIFWFVLGIPVAVIDAWLSIQSMFGVINPQNFAGFAAAVIVGAALTAFAVSVPIIYGQRPSLPLRAFWGTVAIVDIGTSIIGAIWYGALNQPLNSRIDFSELYFDLNNWQQTGAVLIFVLIVAWVCVKLGQALNRLRR